MVNESTVKCVAEKKKSNKDYECLTLLSPSLSLSLSLTHRFRICACFRIVENFVELAIINEVVCRHKCMLIFVQAHLVENAAKWHFGTLLRHQHKVIYKLKIVAHAKLERMQKYVLKETHIKLIAHYYNFILFIFYSATWNERRKGNFFYRA